MRRRVPPLRLRPTWSALLPALAVCALLLVRSPLPPAGAPGSTEAAAATTGGGVPVTLLAWYDFPRDDPRSVELSGIAWDAATRTLYAISDDAPKIVPLRPSADYRTWAFGDVIPVSIPEEWDGEGIVLTENGFFISNEVGPHVYELDRAGQALAEVPLPAHFRRILRNRALESLTLSPDGRYLFTANETALEGDGPQPSDAVGTTVRILRVDRTSLAAMEYAYRTDPVFAPGEGIVGVVDMAALSATELLVMERHFVVEVGNAIRIYRVGLAGATNVIEVANLSAQTPALAKTLLLDLASLPDAEFPTPRQPQPNKVLDNFEGLALGPALADGRLLFVVSDDGGSEQQTPRILVLTAAGL